MNVYKNDEDIRHLERRETAVAPATRSSIVPSIAGGAAAAYAAGLDAPKSLTHEESAATARHLILPEVGLDGQAKLKAARVLSIGAGGLGSPLALYLAAAGVGTHRPRRLRRRRRLEPAAPDPLRHLRRRPAEARGRGASGCRDINPHVASCRHETRLTSRERARASSRDYDVVVDGTDNFPTRYLVNDACVLLGKPERLRLDLPLRGPGVRLRRGDGPCYRCLYPEPPPPGLVPSCAEGGVLGVLPGLIGVDPGDRDDQAAARDAASRSSVGCFSCDALAMRFRELKLRKNPDCLVCGREADDPRAHRLRGLLRHPAGGGEPEGPRVPEITVEGLRELRQSRSHDYVLLDVREPHEIAICAFPESLRIPLGALAEKVNRLSTADEIVVHCKTGGRSARAVEFLQQMGFTRVRNLAGGIDRWAERIDPSVPRY